jgi:hypothetical protein
LINPWVRTTQVLSDARGTAQSWGLRIGERSRAASAGRHDFDSSTVFLQFMTTPQDVYQVFLNTATTTHENQRSAGSKRHGAVEVSTRMMRFPAIPFGGAAFVDAGICNGAISRDQRRLRQTPSA